MYRSRIIIIFLAIIGCSVSAFAADNNSSCECIVTESEDPLGRHLDDNIAITLWGNISRLGTNNTYHQKKVIASTENSHIIISTKTYINKTSVLIPIRHIVCVYRE